MTLPEMVFGGSHLTVSSQSLGSKFTFNARDSLQACGKDAGIQVLLTPLSRSPSLPLSSSQHPPPRRAMGQALPFATIVDDC